jgi:hypothetical protein
MEDGRIIHTYIHTHTHTHTRIKSITDASYAVNMVPCKEYAVFNCAEGLNKFEVFKMKELFICTNVN